MHWYTKSLLKEMEGADSYGAGIVYDSVPESEYQECLNKAGAVVEAIKMADGGIDYDSTY